jgi:hypothetical protein
MTATRVRAIGDVVATMIGAAIALVTLAQLFAVPCQRLDGPIRCACQLLDAANMRNPVVTASFR